MQKKYLVKLSYSAQKLQFLSILFPYKLFVAHKKTNVNKLKFSNFEKFCCEYPLINYFEFIFFMSKLNVTGQISF